MAEAIHGTLDLPKPEDSVVENDKPSILVADNENTVGSVPKETEDITHDKDNDKDKDKDNDNDILDDPHKSKKEKEYDEQHPGESGDISRQQQQEDPGYNSSASSANELTQMKSRASSGSSFSSIPNSVVVHHGHRHRNNDDRSKEGRSGLLPVRSASPTTTAASAGDDKNGYTGSPSLLFSDYADGGSYEDGEDISPRTAMRRTQKSKPKPNPSGIGFGETMRSLRNIREREMAFRHPSSVRDMQMHTEDEDDGGGYYNCHDDDGYLSPPPPPRRRVYGRHRSSGSRSPPYYSPRASVHHKQQQQQQQQQQLSSPPPPTPPPVTKEYPLVLLHCNLLPPTLSLPASVGVPDPRILQEVLPPKYWKRWKLLEEKIGLGIIRDRGVLISHPQDMYDLLEERLLESLELQRPRLHGGHFLAEEDDSRDMDNANNTNTKTTEDESCTDEEQGEECPDCGRRVIRYNSDGNTIDGNGKRKWEVRVLAANGLMRAGAWAAAWKEMERVDVEVGLWLPSDVRRELERRVAGGGQLHDAATRCDEFLRPLSSLSSNYSGIMQPPEEGGQGEVRSPPAAIASAFVPPPPPESLSSRPSLIPEILSQNQIDGLYDDPVTGSGSRSKPAPECPSDPVSKPAAPSPAQSQKTSADIDLQTLLINYIRILASDRRNIAIMVLSILVVFLAAGALRFGGNVPSLFLLDSGPGSILSLSRSGGGTTDLVESVEL